MPLDSSKNSLLTSLLFLLTPFLLSSCSDDKEEAYPSIVTELADGITNTEGKMTRLVLDDNTELTLTNPLTGLKPSTVYRCLAGFTRAEEEATLRTLTGAYLLRDSTAKAISDPVSVVSLWRTQRYINLHLRPKTQGGKQTWGFIVESIEGRHAYLRLHHRQGTDPTAYSTDIYASLPLDLVDADEITIRIVTFDGTKEWEL